MMLQHKSVPLRQGKVAGAPRVPPMAAPRPAVLGFDAANSCSSSSSVATGVAARRIGPVPRSNQGLVVCQAQPGLMNLPIDRDLEEPLPGFDSIKDALADLAAGKFLVVLDDEDRENEGDLIFAADRVTTEAMHYMVEYTSGVICIAMEGKDLDRLRLPLMVSSAENEEAMYTAFTVTVDLKDGITTGISASDRAKTIRKLADPTAVAADFRRPGHIFPLRYRPGGVLVRPGHTEASVDLARLAGCYPAGVLCEIVNKADGSMARTPELRKYAKEHGLKCITIADLIRYRLRHEQLVQLQATASVNTRHGPMTVHAFKSALDGAEHLAFVAGSVAGQEGVPVHVHREAGVSDILSASSNGSAAEAGAASGSGRSLDAALAAIAAEGRGVVVQIRTRLEGEPSVSQELQQLQGRQAASPQQEPLDIREYGLAAQMLKTMGVQSARVPADDARALQALQSCGVKVSACTSCGSKPAAQHHASSNGVSNGALAGAR